jgi:uncharacterized protein (TIGR03382 family)
MDGVSMERTTVLAVALLVTLAGGPGLATAGSQEQVTLTVTVVDERGQPVSGATLVASWDGGETTEETRANGQALIDVPQGANVSIAVRSDTYVRNVPLEVTDAREQSVESTVARQGSATISVVDTGGQPVGNAIVRMWHDGQVVVNTRTDDDGVLESPTIEQGEYRLIVFREGYFRNASDLAVTGDVSRQVAIQQGSATVTFAVTDPHFDPPRPVENATISVGDIGTVRTLGNGEATIQVPVNARTRVSVTKPNYSAVTRRLVVGEDATTLDVSIRRTPALAVRPANDRVVVGESVTVAVTDEYGDAVEGATVQFDGDSVGQTDTDGELSVTIESEGTHRIAASTGNLTAAATVEGVRAATETPSLTATPTPTATRTATAADAPTTTAPSFGFGPGFTPVTALVAVLVAIGLVLLRRRRR